MSKGRNKTKKRPGLAHLENKRWEGWVIVAEKFRQFFYLNSFFGTLLYLALGITGLPDYIPLQAKDLS